MCVCVYEFVVGVISRELECQIDGNDTCEDHKIDGNMYYLKA